MQAIHTIDTYVNWASTGAVCTESYQHEASTANVNRQLHVVLVLMLLRAMVLLQQHLYPLPRSHPGTSSPAADEACVDPSAHPHHLRAPRAPLLLRKPVCTPPPAPHPKGPQAPAVAHQPQLLQKSLAVPSGTTASAGRALWCCRPVLPPLLLGEVAGTKLLLLMQCGAAFISPFTTCREQCERGRVGPLDSVPTALRRLYCSRKCTDTRCCSRCLSTWLCLQRTGRRLLLGSILHWEQGAPWSCCAYLDVRCDAMHADPVAWRAQLGACCHHRDVHGHALCHHQCHTQPLVAVSCRHAAGVGRGGSSHLMHGAIPAHCSHDGG